MSITQSQKAFHLLELHHASNPLILINAWDAASAAMVAHCGLPAVATSSAALANALGFADGQYLPWAQMLDAVARICRVVQVPVTADIEAGFAPDLKALETSITQIIQAGAVGVNLEDAMPKLQTADLQNEEPQNADPRNAGFKTADPVRHGNPLFPLAEQIARIQATRRAAQAAGIHLVINARTDAYWQSGVTPEEALRNTLERGKAYLQAGADCIFVPGLRSPGHIKTIIDYLRTNYVRTDHSRPDRSHADQSHSDQSRTHQSHADHLSADHHIPPVNILAGPGVPSIPELAKLDVKRVSYGSGPHRAAMGLLRRIAEEARTSGTFQSLTEGAVPYEEINGLMGK